MHFAAAAGAEVCVGGSCERDACFRLELFRTRCTSFGFKVLGLGLGFRLLLQGSGSFHWLTSVVGRMGAFQS